MARILGLDLGSYSVKAVVLETNLRSYSTLAYAEVRCSEGRTQAQIEALGVPSSAALTDQRLERIKAVLPELLAKVPFTADTT